jgi:hypothetical protein
MGEIIRLSLERIHITVYLHGLRFSWGKRAVRRRTENERTLAVIQAVVKELGQGYFEIHTRSWPARCIGAIWHGGWRSPVVMVGNSVYSQACIPDRAELRAYLNEQIHILRPRLEKSS